MSNTKENQISSFDTSAFANVVIGSSWYSKLQTLANSDTDTKVLYKILNYILYDTCNSRAFEKYFEYCRKIDIHLEKIFAHCTFTSGEITGLRTLLADNNYDLMITIPSDDWISSGVKYDPDGDKVCYKPFNSWTFASGRWNPPVTHPDDGKMYEWDESAYQADNTVGWVLIT